MSTVETPDAHEHVDEEQHDPNDPPYVHAKRSLNQPKTWCGLIDEEPVCCGWEDGFWMGRTDCLQCGRPICPTCYQRISAWYLRKM